MTQADGVLGLFSFNPLLSPACGVAPQPILGLARQRLTYICNQANATVISLH